MKEVIKIIINGSNEKPVELTHYIRDNGWEETETMPTFFEKIVYLGNCKRDGDMFACYKENFISIYKGHLNSGKY